LRTPVVSGSGMVKATIGSLVFKLIATKPMGSAAISQFAPRWACGNLRGLGAAL